MYCTEETKYKAWRDEEEHVQKREQKHEETKYKTWREEEEHVGRHEHK